MSMSRRNRSSTTASTPLPSSESAKAIQDNLENLADSLQDEGNLPSIGTLVSKVRRIRIGLESSPTAARAQDAFRHVYGFSILLATLRAASGFYHSDKRTELEKSGVFELLAEVLSTLSEVFREHYGNRKYFKQRVDGGGWAALEQAIASIGFGGSDSDSWTENRLFGILLAFAVDDARLRMMCQAVQEQYRPRTPDSSKEALVNPSSEPSAALENQEHEPQKEPVKRVGEEDGHSESDRDFMLFFRAKLENLLGHNVLLPNADIIPTIIGFWKALPRDRPAADAPASLIVVEFLYKLTTLSPSNLLALHSTGILSPLLPLALEEDTTLPLVERGEVEKLCDILVTLGLSALNDARYLVRSKSPRAAEFLLRMAKFSHDPSHIQFDLSLNGYSSLELNLGRPFPPPTSSPGYTFSAWIYVNKFDQNVHTTLFGVLDPTQTCFVLAYIESDTHNFILQTSVNSSRPSVRFKSTVFQENRWYHIAFVHRRPRTISSSKAALYVNGEFAEQVKISYPAAPPPTNASTESFTSFSSAASTKFNPVQAFVGTPRDLATRLGQGVASLRWCLASAHLFDDVLSDDFLAVHYRLGPRYNGNYQDCLGSFQTYEASAALGMRNELLHPGKDDKSDILTAIREKASSIVPEHRVLLSILPTAVLYDESRGDHDLSQLMKGLTKTASNNLYQLGRSNNGYVAINAAVPSINEALIRVSGTCTMTGEPIIVVPQAIDNAMWRLGGCTAIGLKLVENANTRKEIVRSVEILFEIIKGSWRNSEAMERENGYAVLSALLRGKLGSSTALNPGANSSSTPVNPLGPAERDALSIELLGLVLGFLGYDHDNPENSIINNPFAYRTLLVDYDMWRRATPVTQKLYYRQFSVFGIKSKNHHFNARRLLRMRIVKRFMDALKTELFLAEVFPDFLEALLILVKGSLSAEIFRSLSLFITYALHNHNAPSSQASLARNGHSSSRVSISSLGPRRPTVSTTPESRMLLGEYMSKRELAIGVLEMYTGLLCEQGTTANLKKFATTVTNKWLLHLITEDEPRIVVLGSKILARLLVVNGTSYLNKFAEKSGGFVIMQHRLKKWWDIPTLWPIVFCVMFNLDVAEIDFERSFELYSLLEIFGKSKVVNVGVLPILMAMLQQGLKSLLHSQDDPASPLREKGSSNDQPAGAASPTTSGRDRSMSLTKELESRHTNKPRKDRLGGQATVLHTVIRFLSDLHANSQNFKDFASQPEYVRQLLLVLYPAIVSSDIVPAEIELNSRDSVLTFDNDDVVIRPRSRLSSRSTPIVRASIVETQVGSNISSTGTNNARGPQLRRGSSFILLTSKSSDDLTKHSPSKAKLTGITSPKKEVATQQFSHAVVEELLELVIGVFIDQVLARKEFPGFGLFLKVPPGFQEHQAYFESYILRNTVSQLSNTIKLEQKLLWEPRVITNMARFCMHMGEAVYEGWFLGGAEPLLDFSGDLLDYLQRSDVAVIKSVRLCSQAISSIRSVFVRVALLRLSEIDGSDVSEVDALEFMNKLTYWQTVVLSAEINQQENFLKLICYQLYTKLVDLRPKIRNVAADLWRILLVQKPDETSNLLSKSVDKKELVAGFKGLMELDNDTFLEWVEEHRQELDNLFFGALARAWEDFVNTENSRTDETAKARVHKRRERVKQWHSDERNTEDVLFRHELASTTWGKNVYDAEHLKHQRAMQDQQDNLSYIAATFLKMNKDLHRPCAVFDDNTAHKWQQDRTEGRNRMRLRMLPDRSADVHDYQPKRRTTDASTLNHMRKDSRLRATSGAGDPVVATRPTIDFPIPGVDGVADGGNKAVNDSSGTGETDSQAEPAQDDEFELVDDPNGQNDENYEDKNRKVMRSLHRGEQVQHVYNITRIIGLETCEGILIIGKDSLYLIDNVFQRSDAEIVNVSQAPIDERDPYLQMISGQQTSKKAPQQTLEQEARSWKWDDVLSVSKRRFLFRDVAIEVFFCDGRSYLLTAISHTLRDDLYGKLTSKAPHTTGSSVLPNPEDAWRLESLKVSEDIPTGFSSKFGSIFNSSGWNPAMRRWAKGEISNFHYLMLVNTMAGRTFNDLTQYPVFPWVLADYTSDELDLDNPTTFRDLSKPMGCQHASRQADFMDRYKSFAEMGDQPAFHYGTHYSSAMIVTSYLIRLQPFVQSYLLLQGGSFDHPDRLFYSIEKAWASAARDNMTDVRELIPEFFYLPEFLTNSNGYNFGLRQGNAGAIDNVALPPWANGDPKIFIAKHREALESPYVSRHLHQWIDLIFGSKQRGEAAVDNVNVFHHLSYHGAKDLDLIEDPVERLATIGIIHNFGQTPHQVFLRSHQAHEDTRNKLKRLDTVAESLTKVPYPLFEIHEAVVSLIYSEKLDRLLCATAFRLNIPPNFDKYMEWGYADNSIRFYACDSKRLIGLFENTHQGQISCAAFADSRTLITAGTDCVISVWTLGGHGSKYVTMVPKTSLFGHKQPVSSIAVSRSFSTILSASSDGQVILWDLNRLEFVRRVTYGRPVECAQINDVTGDIMLCRGQKVALYTLNGDLFLDQNVCSEHDDYIFSCAFYEGTGNEWLESSLLFTGHRRGVVNVWKKCARNGKWALELVKRLDHVEARNEGKSNSAAAITCIRPMAQIVYTGDEEGRVYEWDCVQRER